MIRSQVVGDADDGPLIGLAFPPDTSTASPYCWFMTVFSSAANAAVQGQLVRGLPTRNTALMEQYQFGVIQAIASAAGCNVSATFIDNGIDMDIWHELPGDDEVPLRVQLKAVTNGWNVSRTLVSASMSRKRFDQMRRGGSLDSIVVVMDLPSAQEDWAWSQGTHTELRHDSYWLNLRGAAAQQGTSKTVTVSAPVSNVFDDVALCQMMARIRAGSHP
jgi:hypothetical protein